MSAISPAQGKSLTGRGYAERANLVTGAVLNVNGQTPFSKEMPMGEGWYKMNLRLYFNVTIGTGAGVIAEGTLLMVRNVLLRTDRGEVVCNIPGRALYKIATYKTGTPPRLTPLAAATAVYTVYLPIFFEDPYYLVERREDTILDTSRYRTCSLLITLGGVADLYTAPGTAAVSATMDIEVERSLGILPAEAKPYYLRSYDYRPPVDASVLTSIDLERSPDMSICRLFVHASTPIAGGGNPGFPWYGVNSDSIQAIETIKDQNKFIDFQRAHGQILDQNMIDAKMATVMNGVSVFDFIHDGSISSALATGDKSVLQYYWTNVGGPAAGSLVTATQEMIRTLK